MGVFRKVKESLGKVCDDVDSYSENHDIYDNLLEKYRRTVLAAHYNIATALKGLDLNPLMNLHEDCKESDILQGVHEYRENVDKANDEAYHRVEGIPDVVYDIWENYKDFPGQIDWVKEPEAIEVSSY